MFSSLLHPPRLVHVTPAAACLTGPVPTDPLGCFHSFTAFFGACVCVCIAGLQKRHLRPGR